MAEPDATVSVGPAQYGIGVEDGPLLAAAVALGDWLATLPETSPAQRATIAAVQAALRALPAMPPDGFAAGYGFEGLELGAGPAVWRAWWVGFDGRRTFDVYSIYIPRVAWSKRDFVDEIAHEVEAEWRADGARLAPYNYDRWIAEVAGADAFRARCHEFAVTVEADGASATYPGSRA